MKRRLFIGLLTALGISATGFSASVDRSKVSLPEVTVTHHAGFVEIAGPTESLETAYDVFQTVLWPGWKRVRGTDRCLLRQDVEIYRQIREAGSLQFVTTGYCSNASEVMLRTLESSSLVRHVFVVEKVRQK